MTDNGNAKSTIGPVLGRTPSGVFILVAGDGEGRTTGMLASWVQQSSFEPPMVTVAVNAKRYVNEWLAKSPAVVLHLVGETQSGLLKHFGRGFEPDQPAFEGLSSTAGPEGLPILSQALGHLAGKVVDRLATGDHIVYAVAVTGGASGPNLDDESPMVHIRKNGFSY